MPCPQIFRADQKRTISQAMRPCGIHQTAWASPWSALSSHVRDEPHRPRSPRWYHPLGRRFWSRLSVGGRESLPAQAVGIVRGASGEAPTGHWIGLIRGTLWHPVPVRGMAWKKIFPIPRSPRNSCRIGPGMGHSVRQPGRSLDVCDASLTIGHPCRHSPVRPGGRSSKWRVSLESQAPWRVLSANSQRRV